MVQLAVSGRVTDLTSGVDPSSAAFFVTNEDGIRQISGSVSLAADGIYGFTAVKYLRYGRRRRAIFSLSAARAGVVLTTEVASTVVSVLVIGLQGAVAASVSVIRRVN